VYIENLLGKLLHRLDEQVVQGKLALVLPSCGLEELGKRGSLVLHGAYGVLGPIAVVHKGCVDLQDL